MPKRPADKRHETYPPRRRKRRASRSPASPHPMLRFIFTLLALSEPSGLAEGASPRNDLPHALSGKVLGQAQLTSKWARQR